MDHQDHVQLIQDGIASDRSHQIWADLGSGQGAFTLALRDILDPDSVIHSIDADAGALARQKQQFERTFPNSQISFVVADFTKPLQLPPLDGIVMANSLHFVEYPIQSNLLSTLGTHLKSKSGMIIVEYDSDRGNQWVPYPISQSRLVRLAQNSGYEYPQILNTAPSTFMSHIYSALLTHD